MPTDAPAWPGQRLGLPASGPGSMATFGRRFVAILIDWGLCQLVSYLVVHPRVGAGHRGSFVPLGLFALENIVLLSTLGSTIGHRIVGLRVGALGRGLTPVAVVIRTVLLCLVLPALLSDGDGRGLHDRLAGTVIVRR